eukprot:2528696-Amphidinium_carterae.1
MAARLDRLETNAEVPVRLPTMKQLNEVTSMLREVGVADLGVFVSSLAQLCQRKCSIPKTLVEEVLQQALRQCEQLTWQTVGHLDMGTRTLVDYVGIKDDDALLLKVLHGLRQRALHTISATSIESQRVNWLPEQLFLRTIAETLSSDAGELLVVESPLLAEHLQKKGIRVSTWQRMSNKDKVGSVEQHTKGEGRICGAVLRLFGVQSSAGGEALQSAATACAASLGPGMPIYVCGLVAEGIEAAQPTLEET